ncbi:hypothetical protein FQA39_LY01634 [Lamprigera yunnana]|nr:hypothetical protein FQA39_LY01634 [Lamprigera yunnana]
MSEFTAYAGLTLIFMLLLHQYTKSCSNKGFGAINSREPEYTNLAISDERLRVTNEAMLHEAVSVNLKYLKLFTHNHIVTGDKPNPLATTALTSTLPTQTKSPRDTRSPEIPNDSTSTKPDNESPPENTVFGPPDLGLG